MKIHPQKGNSLVKQVVLKFENFKLIMLMIILICFSACKKDFDQSVQSQDQSRLGNLKDVDVRVVAENLVSPLGLEEAPDNTKRLFIFDQAGKIYIVDSNGTMLP